MLAVLVREIGALIEYKAAIYEAGELDQDLNLSLTSAKDQAAVALQEALKVKSETKAKNKK